MFKFTPGVVFVSRAAARLFLPIASVVLSTIIFEKNTGHTLTISQKSLVCVGVVPLFFVGRLCLEGIHRRREMLAMGAIPVPVWKGKWPGNFDLLVYMKDQLDNNYLGAGFPVL